LLTYLPTPGHSEICRGQKVMAKKRVFISFDYDHDETLKTFLVGQSKHADSPFELADWSIKEHLTGDWKKKAATRTPARMAAMV